MFAFPVTTAIFQFLAEASGQEIYQSQLNAAVRGLWRGVLTADQFFDAMGAAIQRRITQAWREGADSVGISPAEYTPDEVAALAAFIATQFTYISGFADAIQSGSKANDGALSPLLARAALWANRYVEATNQARVMAGANQKLEWVIGPTEEHCSDCGRLNGKVKRGSVWAAYGLAPQSRNLKCKGYNCECKLMPTTKPVTPGPLPRPSQS